MYYLATYLKNAMFFRLPKKLIIGIASLLIFSLTFSGCTHDPFLSKVDRSKTLAINWLKNNFREKGLWRYIYQPSTDTFPSKNNSLRQLMASRVAAEQAHHDSEFKNIHRENLNFIFDHWYIEESNRLGYIYYNSKSKLGSNAMLLRTLSFSPFYPEFEAEAEKTAAGIISLINDDGSFNPWFIEPNYEYDSDYLLTFYSGEAILALVDYYERSQNPKILEKAIQVQDFYLDQYIEKLEKNYYPAYVPWHTQSLNKLYKITNDQKYANAIFTLNDKLLEIFDRTNYPGRFYNPNTPQYGTPHVASDAVYTEGLAYALEIAQLTGDDQRAKNYRKAITLAVDNLTSLQYCYEESISAEIAQKACGGFRYRVDDERIRVDNVQHAIDAYIKIEEIW